MLRLGIKFFFENKLVVGLLLVVLTMWGFATAPFDWESDFLQRSPVGVDAIPDIGENQQIVFTEWKGRSPQDIDDQVTYPLSHVLLGIPGVKTIRSTSVFGFSSIYIIFEEGIEYYWSRSRILEKLNSLPKGTLPNGVQPGLGPDATALGQIFWYTLEGRDTSGQTVGGWDLHELRSIQDYIVKYSLASVSGVSEVASIGGFVKEYQIDLSPFQMQAQGIGVTDVMNAVKGANLDIGAKTIEFNRVEFMIRGLGNVKSIEDLENAVIKDRQNVPIKIKDIAKVTLGPATRRGILDKAGSEAVGGVVVARFGANPLEVINKVKEQIQKISSGLPKRTLGNGTISQVSIVPFYDRTELIYQTLATLEDALSLEILITIVVIILMVLNLRASLLISSLLPVSVLMCFILMKHTGVDANIVALSGIAIAIGTMVDMGIVVMENIIQHLERRDESTSIPNAILNATLEVAGAVVAAIATTIVSFIPVFAMEAAEGKLFHPLAYTKTFALIAAIFSTLIFLPALARLIFSVKIRHSSIRLSFNLIALLGGLILIGNYPVSGLILTIIGLTGIFDWWSTKLDKKWAWIKTYTSPFIYALLVVGFITTQWEPLGPEHLYATNYLFVSLVVFGLILFFFGFIRIYDRLLLWCLKNKGKFLLIPAFVLLWGALSWFGVEKVFGFLPEFAQKSSAFQAAKKTFPKAEKEFMPALDEGTFLLMPSTMPHAGMEENGEVLSLVDMAVNAIPEVKMVVGKLGRVESALDPAPTSMFENIIHYKPEYKTDKEGEPIRFSVDEQGSFLRNSKGQLIPDPNGEFYRNWRKHINNPDDIWKEISSISIPGLTSAPRLQPIQTRLVMLQSGMRAPLGVKLTGPDLDSLQALGYAIEKLIKTVPGVKDEAVFADRIVGKPYIEVIWDRKKLALFGLKINEVQKVFEVAVGGIPLGATVEGRERYPIRVRYARELRDEPEDLKRILVPTSSGTQIPLGDLAEIKYQKGPQAIKSENTFLVSYVLLDKVKGVSEVEIAERVKTRIDTAVKEGKIHLPFGTKYELAGTFENQVRAEKKLAMIIPLALLIIFLILYFQFGSVPITLMIFSGILVAFAGGFIMIWLYGQPWFLNFNLFGENLRELFNVETVNLSVAVWVGFIALFGIATDDGVVLATYIKQSIAKKQPSNKEEARQLILLAGKRRIRPCLMTTATTLLALLPILTSTGRGSDIMIPMAIPAFGGMLIELITLFVIPVLFAAWQERQFSKSPPNPETHI